MIRRTHRRSGAIAALATFALFGVSTPALAAGPDRGPRHADDTRSLLRDVARAVSCSLDGCGHDHLHGRTGRSEHHRRARPRVIPASRSHTIIDGRCHTWVRGHWAVTHERICVSPARTHRIWVEPRYRTRYDPCGRAVRVLVRAGHWDTYTVPARYETRPRRVYREGHWKACGADCGHRGITRHRADRGADRRRFRLARGR